MGRGREGKLELALKKKKVKKNNLYFHYNHSKL